MWWFLIVPSLLDLGTELDLAYEMVVSKRVDGSRLMYCRKPSRFLRFINEVFEGYLLLFL